MQCNNATYKLETTLLSDHIRNSLLYQINCNYCWYRLYAWKHLIPETLTDEQVDPDPDPNNDAYCLNLLCENIFLFWNKITNHIYNSKLLEFYYNIFILIWMYYYIY